MKEKDNIYSGGNGGKTGGNGGRNCGNLEGLSENEKSVYLQVMENGSQTAKQISDNTGIPKRTVERALKRLKDNGIIVRIGSSRSGRWELGKLLK
ncbi:MAG: helix-turn-helix domain-containing protein [Eubacterium sp.]|nr:helix-turn-helix domain-containing protein [Eubacterium sp.]